MKALFCLIILILLGVTAMGPPINYDRFVYTPAFKQSQEVEVINIKYDISSDIGTNLKNPNKINITLSSNTEDGEISFAGQQHLTVELYKNSVKLENVRIDIQSLNQGDRVVKISKDSPLQYTIDLSKSSTKLPEGNYNLKVYPNSKYLLDKPDFAPLDIQFSYITSDIQYTPTLKATPGGMRLATVYYIDGFYQQHLVPITKVIPLRDSHGTPIYIGRAILDELRKVPGTNSGLMDLSPIAPIPSVYYINLDNNSRTAFIDIYPNFLKPNSEAKYNKFAIDAFVKSFSNLASVDKVKFTGNDGKELDTIFDNIKVNKPIERSSSPSLYLALENMDKKSIFLLDYRDYSFKSANMEGLAYEILEVLKAGLYQDGYFLSQTVPPMVELNKIDISNNTLRLDFNKALVDYYQESLPHQSIMMDSLIMSYLSIPQIDFLQITVEGQSNLTVGGWDLSNIISMPIGVNPMLD